MIYSDRAENPVPRIRPICFLKLEPDASQISWENFFSQQKNNTAHHRLLIIILDSVSVILLTQHDG